MTTWTEGQMLAFDLETTDTDQENGRIATACAAIMRAGAVEFQRDWMVAIDVEMSPEASAVNKLTTEHLREHGRPATELIPEIANAIRYATYSHMPIVAYNAAFDLTFLDRECRRWLQESLHSFCGYRDIAPVIDPFVIWKAVDRFRSGKRKLTDACAAFGVDLGENAHEASADAIAATRVVHKMAQRYPHIGAMPLNRLHAAQVEWRREQCDSLRAYFDSNGTPHDGVDGSWPLKPYQEQEVPV